MWSLVEVVNFRAFRGREDCRRRQQQALRERGRKGTSRRTLRGHAIHLDSLLNITQLIKERVNESLTFTMCRAVLRRTNVGDEDQCNACCRPSLRITLFIFTP